MRRSFIRKNAMAMTLAIGLLLSATTVTALAQGQQEWVYQPQPGENRPQAYAIYQHALAAFQAGDNNTCLQLCKTALNLDHANKHLIHLEALAYAQAGDNYNAMMMFRSALTLDYNFLPCRNNYGMFMKKTGKRDEAQHMFEECIRIDPKYPDAYYHLGEILREKGDLDQAIENFEQATRLNPNYFEAQRDLGLAIYERAEQGMGGQIVDSMGALQKASRLVPDNPMIWYHIGVIDCALGKLDDAEAMFRTSLMKDAKLAASHWELARIRYLRGDPDRCVSEILICKKINPVYTDSHKYPSVDLLPLQQELAECYEVKGKMEDAMDTFKDVASMQKNNTATLKHIADLQKELKANAKRHSSKKAPSFDPAEVQALVTKGISESEDGDIEGAKHSFDRALELNPNSYEATQNIGALLEASGDLTGAMAKYQQAMALEPTFDGALYNMAYVLEKANLPADAGMMYQRFHELAGRYPYDPKHIVALQQDDARERARQEQLKKRGY
ncbi:MAG TPA: tetratricopeptide repeat protein [Trichormus sp.]|jgi:tetratricopeptide (TPR) repeat protein